MALVDEAIRQAPDDGYFVASRGEIRWRAGDHTAAREPAAALLDVFFCF